MLALAAALASAPSAALAAWPNNPGVNQPVCTAANLQTAARIVPDGAGGAIIAWQDERGGSSYDIYAQHVTASGAVDPTWPANGLAVCTAADFQAGVQVVSDGAGGAIATWGDRRSGSYYDIYAQHVLPSGVVDPAWPVNGRQVCGAALDQTSPVIVSDGAGGAVIAWQDYRNGFNWDIYAQHVLASGAVDPAWPLDGQALCTASQSQQSPQIVSDGAGGAIVTWQDLRTGTTDIYAQRVMATGVVSPTWPANGQVICGALSYQYGPMIASDGAGGAIIAWEDYRSGTNYDIYAQHVLASGTVDAGWPVDGRVLCAAANGQYGPVIASDGGGGAIVAWYDQRSGSAYHIYAQHVLASGVPDPAWPLDGSAVCLAPSNQYAPVILSDGAGGALVTWEDYRSLVGYDVYAQHMLANGTADPSWPTDGRAISTATGDQSIPAIAPDGAGGALIVWSDGRADVDDIYAQRVARFGYLGTPEAEIVAARDVPNDQGGRVKLSWNASWLDLAQDPNLSGYDVLRSVPPAAAAARRAAGAPVRMLAEGLAGAHAGDLLVQAAGASTYYWEYVTNVQALHYVSGYSNLVPTAADSTAASNPLTAFMVVARNTTGSMFWPSQPALGYSVDNLAPVAPAPFTGNRASGVTFLHWDRNTEADLAGYRLYRGASAGFVPGPGDLVAALADTGYADAAPPSYYKLTAIDIHGNESPVALLSPASLSGVGPGVPPARAFLELAGENPVRGAAALRFGLVRAGRVTLALYDAGGRRVRTLVEGDRPAGTYAATWDGRDDAGGATPPGLYFARFDAPGFGAMQRIARLE